jgi:hypothetical protein
VRGALAHSCARADQLLSCRRQIRQRVIAERATEATVDQARAQIGAIRKQIGSMAAKRGASRRPSVSSDGSR